MENIKTCGLKLQFLMYRGGNPNLTKYIGLKIAFNPLNIYTLKL
jgi:hypothetical protein